MRLKWIFPLFLLMSTGLLTSFDKNNTETQMTFAELLAAVAQVNPMLRVRFSTSHPKDIGDDVLHTIAKYKNICNK